jgi:hypothetical protein
MRVGIRSRKDFYAGLIFLVCGLVALFESRTYPMGTAARMSSGYFPTLVGSGLTLMGFVISIRGLYLKGENASFSTVRPLAVVTASIVCFALLIRPAGIVVAIIASVLVSCFAGSRFRLSEVVLLSVVLAAISAAVFIFGLGLPMKLYWGN